MAPGPGDAGRDLESSPEAIHARMKRTRAKLERDLDALKNHLFEPPSSSSTGARSPMPPKRAQATSSSKKTTAKKTTGKKASGKKSAAKKTTAKASAAKKTTAKKTTAKAKGSTGKKKTTSARKRGSGTVELLGRMATGAAVGAVTGAARRVQGEPTAVKPALSAEPKKTTEAKAAGRKRVASKADVVLGEMATGAAVGAVTGAVKAVAPPEGSSTGGEAGSS